MFIVIVWVTPIVVGSVLMYVLHDCHMFKGVCVVSIQITGKK